MVHGVMNLDTPTEPLKELFEIEERYSSSGVLNENSESFDERLIKARVIDGNFKKAQAMLLENPRASDLQKIRTLIARGLLDQAEQITHETTSSNPEVNLELMLERSRLANAAGKWSEAESITREALDLGTTGPTRLTLLQVLSIALYEQSKFSESKKIVDKILILSELFPKGLVVVYAQCLNVKLIAEMESVREAIFVFQQVFEHVLFFHKDNPDAWLTLLRTQASLQRKLKSSPVSEALAAFQVSKLLGDDLYQDLALSELYSWRDSSLEKLLDLKGMRDRLQKYERVKQHMSYQGSSTAVELGAAFATSTSTCVYNESTLNGCKSILYLGSSDYLLDLTTRSATLIQLQPKIREFVKALSNFSLDEAELFKKVWKLTRYSKEVHYENIRTSIKRLRAQTGIEVAKKNDLLFLKDTIVVGELSNA